MKKDYDYYQKRAGVISYFVVIIAILAASPILFHFTIVSKDVTGYIQLGLALTAFSCYFLYAVWGNRAADIKMAARRQKKKEEFNNILILIKENKDQEAYNALCDYDNKYNQS